MMLNWYTPLIALGTPPNGQSQSTAPWWMQMFPFFLLIVVFYFALIRPQQRKAKEHERLIKAIGKGDKIVTSSGIVGTVVGVKERTVSIRSEDAKLEVLKSAVTEVTERSTESKS
jgi:preprotein translocase subunit YajC